MELFKNIRLKAGKAILKKKVARMKRKVIYSNISKVKNIGIVWDASKPEDFKWLSAFHQKMHEREINVKILGYFPGKNLPDQYTAIRYFTCIKKQELNLLYYPVSPETSTFINKRYDVLIDINFRRLLPLSYISSLSKAGFKVGLFDTESNNSPFDLMIEIKNSVNLDNYLTQVLHYLEMINSSSGKTADK